MMDDNASSVGSFYTIKYDLQEFRASAGMEFVAGGA